MVPNAPKWKPKLVKIDDAQWMSTCRMGGNGMAYACTLWNCHFFKHWRRKAIQPDANEEHEKYGIIWCSWLSQHVATISWLASTRTRDRSLGYERCPGGVGSKWIQMDPTANSNRVMTDPSGVPVWITRCPRSQLVASAINGADSTWYVTAKMLLLMAARLHQVSCSVGTLGMNAWKTCRSTCSAIFHAGSCCQVHLHVFSKHESIWHNFYQFLIS